MSIGLSQWKLHLQSARQIRGVAPQSTNANIQWWEIKSQRQSTRNFSNFFIKKSQATKFVKDDVDVTEMLVPEALSIRKHSHKSTVSQIISKTITLTSTTEPAQFAKKKVVIKNDQP